MLTDPPLNKLSLARINAGVAYLKLTESPAIGSGAPAGQFQGWLTHVHVPDTCLPYAFKQHQQLNEGDEQQQQQRSNDDLLLLEDGGGGGGGGGGDNSNNTEIPSVSTRCFYEGRLFEDGSAWTAVHDRCMMCSCQRGRVVCDQVVCPSLALTCTAPTATIVHQAGDCCPICELTRNSNYSTMSKLLNSTFNLFLPAITSID